MRATLFVSFVLSFGLFGCADQQNGNDRDGGDTTATVRNGESSEEGGEKASDTAETATISDIAIQDLPPIPVPSGFKKLGEATGNLDDDPTPERVVVYDTEVETQMGTQRQIYVYQAGEKEWKLWHKSTGAVLPSQHGGMMGDPFDGITIERGAIVINHFGGSRQKWHYTHRFRHQGGGWELIGATIHYGAPCDYWEDLDYNLSTGKALYTKEVEDCDKEGEEAIAKEEKTFTRKLTRLPSMDGFYPGDTEMKIPGTEESMWY